MEAQADPLRGQDDVSASATTQQRLRDATLAADRAEYQRTTMGQRVEQAMILSKELGELAARGLKRTDK